ncbi:MAG TPA: BACON domain-containing carbohydrate-binding protein, partial [Vicinamibacterales bacterium]|nr:BACON domain-containing carbohydrate-binding protein [Vicinamibacterales bacterium]
TATSNVSWLTIGGAGSGTGSGVVTMTASANSGASRTGTATIAGQTFKVTQAGTCAASLKPSSASMPAAGGDGPQIAVNSAAGCAWTATTSDTWLTINQGATGSGNGTVRFAAAQNSGPERTGALNIAGQAFTVTQASGCVSTIDPTSQAAPAAGGAAAPVTVTSPAGCDWTATTATPWLKITQGTSGTGSGTVEFSVAQSTGPARTGTLSIAGQTHTVNQASGCNVTIDPLIAGFTALGGEGQPISVSASASCEWTATTPAAWITITVGASGTGNGAVVYVVEPNSGAARLGTISIATNTFTVSQAAPCSYAIDPTSATFDEDQDESGPVAVTAPAGCVWTAESNDSWITVTSGASGTGSGQVRFEVSKNNGSSTRVGTLTIAGHTFDVTQTAN